MFGFVGRRARTHNMSHRGRCFHFENLERRDLLSVTPPSVTDVTVSSTDWSSSFFDYLQANSLGSEGYSIPTGSTAQSLPLPWNNVNQIKITFSEDVNVDAADFSLSGVNNVAFTVNSFFTTPLPMWLPGH